jgi:hypothetical protein
MRETTRTYSSGNRTFGEGEVRADGLPYALGPAPIGCGLRCRYPARFRYRYYCAGAAIESYPAWGVGYERDMTDPDKPWEDSAEAEEARWANYFSDTPEEQSPQYIAERLDDFVDAWWGVEDARKRANDHRSSNPPPPTVEAFGTVEGLADYLRTQAQYAAELGKVDELVKTAERRLTDVSKYVEKVLPPGTSVVHSYGGREGHAGRHRILHSSSTTPKIQLMPLSS